MHHQPPSYRSSTSLQPYSSTNQAEAAVVQPTWPYEVSRQPKLAVVLDDNICDAHGHSLYRHIHDNTTTSWRTCESITHGRRLPLMLCQFQSELHRSAQTQIRSPCNNDLMQLKHVYPSDLCLYFSLSSRLRGPGRVLRSSLVGGSSQVH